MREIVIECAGGRRNAQSILHQAGSGGDKVIRTLCAQQYKVDLGRLASA